MLVIDGAVLAPWIPEVGMYVRVERGPECRAWHSLGMRAEPTGAYGRVEDVDRTYDDPAEWIAALWDGDVVPVTEGEARDIARAHVGHYYHVADHLDGDRVCHLDGFYAACELAPVSEAEAVAAIEAARAAWWPLAPDERLGRLLGMGRGS